VIVVGHDRLPVMFRQHWSTITCRRKEKRPVPSMDKIINQSQVFESLQTFATLKAGGSMRLNDGAKAQGRHYPVVPVNKYPMARGQCHTKDFKISPNPTSSSLPWSNCNNEGYFKLKTANPDHQTIAQ